MEKRKVGKRKEVKVDFASYCYLFNGIAGIGKTTLAYEVGKKLYGEDGVLILTVGQEPEPDHLGGVLGDRAKTWSELQEILDALIDYKTEDYKDLRVIAIDTVDEIFRLAEEEIVENFNSTVTNDKRVKSIKQAYGGFQGGENKVIDLVINNVFKLRDAGYCIFFIGHTKQKNKKDIMTDIEYEQITSNLEAKYYNAIKDKVNIVACAYTERKMNNLETVKDAFTKKEKTVGRIASEKRVIVFRDEEYAIDVKSHFEYIESKIEFGVDIFIDTIYNAIKKQHEKFHGAFTNGELETLKEKQKNESDLKGEENKRTPKVKPETDVGIGVVNEDKNKELLKIIVTKYKTATDEQKAKIKKILEDNGVAKFDISLPTTEFEKMVQIFG